MTTRAKIVIVAALAAIVAAALIAKRGGQSPPSAPAPATASTVSAPGAATASALPTAARLPKLLELGAGKCVPCKMMAPILDALKEEYAGRLQVEFIDVWQDQDAGKRYGVEMIPTQIFFDADGKERYRHVGFLGKKEILAKWKELGVDLGADPAAGAAIIREEPVRTLNGSVASLDPPAAIAWIGQKRGPDGKWTSADCFKQGFFVGQANLEKWLEARPARTGRQITIAQALADKMKLSPEQIAKACKLGECK